MKSGLMKTLAIVAVFWMAGTAHGFDRMHGAQPVQTVNYDSLFAAAAPLATSLEGRTALDQCLERYGGVEKLKQLDTFRLTYRMKAFLNKDSLDIVKSFANHRKYKISRRGPATNEVRILNHPNAWYQNRDTLIALDGGRYRAELFSYLTLAMPLASQTERFDDMRYGNRDGDSLSYIYMKKQDTLMIVIGIDPRDHLIKSSEGVIFQGEQHFVFINWFSGHREYDGYVFPLYLTNVSMGLEVAQSVVTKVEVNIGYDEKEFNPQPIIDPRTVY